MVKFSNNQYKQKTKVVKIHYKIKSSRLNFLHKLSTQLVNKYNTISIEDFSMKGMSQGLKLSKSISDNS